MREYHESFLQLFVACPSSLIGCQTISTQNTHLGKNVLPGAPSAVFMRIVWQRDGEHMMRLTTNHHRSIYETHLWWSCDNGTLIYIDWPSFKNNFQFKMIDPCTKDPLMTYKFKTPRESPNTTLTNSGQVDFDLCPPLWPGKCFGKACRWKDTPSPFVFSSSVIISFSSAF